MAHSAGQTPDPCLISAAAPPLRPNHRLEPDGRDRGARPSGGSPAPLWPRRLARHITCRPLCSPPRHWPGQVSRRVAPSGIGCATGCWLATLLLFFSSLSPLSPLAVSKDLLNGLARLAEPPRRRGPNFLHSREDGGRILCSVHVCKPKEMVCGSTLFRPGSAPRIPPWRDWTSQ